MSPRRLRAITPIAVARTRVIRGGGEKTTNLGHGLEGGGRKSSVLCRYLLCPTISLLYTLIWYREIIVRIPVVVVNTADIYAR